VAALPGGPGVRDLVKGEGQRLMIREQRELAALQHVAEVPDGLHTGEELPVKRRVVDLGGGELLREEPQRLPGRRRRRLLLEYRAHMVR